MATGGYQDLSNSLNVYTTTNHTNGAYPLQIRYPAPSPQFGLPLNTYSQTFQPEEKKEPMRGLFQVFIVDPENGEIMGGGMRIARDEASARLKAVADQKCGVDKDIDEYDIIVVRLGDVRNKKSVQEVKVIK